MSGAEEQLHQFMVTGGGAGRTTRIAMNGEDLSLFVSALRFEAKVNEMSKLEVTFVPRHQKDVALDVEALATLGMADFECAECRCRRVVPVPGSPWDRKADAESAS